MFKGLSAFPLTPLTHDALDETAFIGLMTRLTDAGVNAIGVLGSTGSYAYLTRHERARIAELAVKQASEIPVMVGISALATRDVLALAEDAQRAGASGVLLAPMSYQKLSDDEVLGLYEDVTRHLSVPLCVYDNPGTTRFEFSDELHGRIAQLPNVASIKIPGVPATESAAQARVSRLRDIIPSHVTIGISGDPLAAAGLNAGCDAWYSVIGGLFPHTALAITHAAQSGDASKAQHLSKRLEVLWELFRQHGGSLRVIATAAEVLGIVEPSCLPLPLKSLEGQPRQHLEGILNELKLH